MLIKVKFIPNSEIDEIVKKKDDEFEVKVKEKAKRGRANRAVIKVFELKLKRKWKRQLSKI
jgi:uncharacterized protein YggU (UPF0235/DUF167 family)